MATIIRTPIYSENLVAQRQRARLRETALGLLFVAPATIITLIFGLFPVVYGFFVSLQGGKALPVGFVGLKNYVQALGGVAYLFGLAVAWVFLWGAYRLWKQGYDAMQAGRGNFIVYLVPAIMAAPATLALLALLFTGNDALMLFPFALIALALAIYLTMNARLPGTQGALYILNSWGVVLFTLSGVILTLFTFQQIGDNTAPTFNLLLPLLTDKGIYLPSLAPQFLGTYLLIAAFGLAFALHRAHVRAVEHTHSTPAMIFGALRWFALLFGILLLLFLIGRADQLRAAAMGIARIDPDKLSAVTDTKPELLASDVLVWPQILALLLGMALIGLAYLSWQSASRRATTPGLLTMIVLAVAFMVGGWLLIGELPNAVATGDPDFYASLLRTATYTFVSVPLELGIGLILAYLLFHEITAGKSLYRMIFFIPYIAPTVATAAVFTVIFSLRTESPANQFMQLLGLPSQQWLRNPNGIFQIIAQVIGGRGVRLPPFLVGPSLPLTTAIIFSVWVFSGYNAVIFMAGLGGVPRELYEAAEVDGAGRWANFRYITLPMISPTTFFLTILAIIGTFQALTHIYVLRQRPGTMDVATVQIFDALRSGLLPYAAAMSFVLFGIIMVLTLVQNRVARDQVFYG